MGLLPQYFFPRGAGRDYEPSPYLERLAAFRDRLTVCSGLAHPLVDGGHAAEACFLTGAPHPASGSFRNLGAQSALTSSSVTSLLNSSTFLANGAATFSFGSRTFLALNDSVAGFSVVNDAVLEITGYSFASGFNSLSQISFV